MSVILGFCELEKEFHTWWHGQAGITRPVTTAGELLSAGAALAAMALLTPEVQAVSPLEGLSEGDERECTLLGGPFAVLLQALLGVAALSTLLYKRAMETPKRPLAVWCFDASKQGLGAALVHVWNLALSIWVASVRRRQHRSAEGGGAAGGDGDDGADECAMYFTIFSLDVVMGTALIWALMRAQRALALRLGLTSLAKTGCYGDPPSARVYLAQLLAYLFILVVVKTLLAFLVLAMDSPLQHAATVMSLPLRRAPELELVLVMVICPWLLNSCQFWALDSIVMHRPTRDISNQYKRIEDGEEAEP